MKAKKLLITVLVRTVPWLRRNEFYMTPVTDELHKRSGEVPEVQYVHITLIKSITNRFGKRTLEQLKGELKTDKDKQISDIQETFELGKKIPK